MGGRCWLLVTLLFRVLVLVGSDVFEDEQEELACNTRQPGCKPMCYDAAFPLSHYRFLLFLVLALSALFLIFAVHQTAKAGLPAGRRSRRLRRFYAGSVALCSAAEVVVVPAGAAAALRLPSAAALRLPPPAGPAPRPLLRVPPHRADRLHPLLLRRRVGVGAAQPGGARPPPAQEPNGPREDPHLRGGGSAAAPPSASCPGCVRRVCRRCDELWLRSAWGGSEVCIGVRKQPCPAAPPLPTRFLLWGSGWASPCSCWKENWEREENKAVLTTNVTRAPGLCRHRIPLHSAHPCFVGCMGATGPRSGAQHVPP